MKHSIILGRSIINTSQRGLFMKLNIFGGNGTNVKIANVCSRDCGISSLLGISNINIIPSSSSKCLTSVRQFSSSSVASAATSREEDEEEDEEDGGNSYSDSSSKNNSNGRSPKTLDSLGRSYGTGRRKTSVARVWLSEGSGQFIVNHRNLVEYFQGPSRDHILEPFIATDTAGRFDVYSTVKGGGFTGQAGALRLGISRALDIFKPDVHSILRKEGHLTRDSRRVERKKPGQKKARKKFQWVKR